MKARHAKDAAILVEALKQIPKVRRALSDKPWKYGDATWLELQAAEMADGKGQGANHWAYVTPKIGRAILDAADKIIRSELRRLGVKA